MSYIGPTFSTNDKAINFLAKEYECSVEQMKEKLKKEDYPYIQDIKVDDKSFYADR